MEYKITASIQILPLDKDKEIYNIVDRAIEVIANSGLKYIVTPLETVIEGSYDEVMDIIKKAQQVCFDAGTEKLYTLVKIVRYANKDNTIDDKLKKYK